MLEITKITKGSAVLNFQAVKEELDYQLAKYRGYVLTDINQAKIDRATLNKLAKSINDQKIIVKKKIMEQYESEIEPQCKELIASVNECVIAIDEGIKAQEQQEREEKKAQIKEIWKKFENRIPVYLDEIYSSKWENKTCSLSTIEKEIQEKLAKIQAEMITAKSIGGEELVLDYLITLDINQTIADYQRKQQILNNAKDEPEREEKVANMETPTLFKVSLEIIGTEEMLHEMGDFLRKKGYSFKQLTDMKEAI